MVQLRRSLLISFFSTNFGTAMYFGTVIVLSRLLTPAEVGVFSISTVFIGILAIFREFGVSSYLLQEKELTPEKIRSAVGLLLTTSWVLTAFIYFSSSYVASYYGQPGIGEVMRVLSISFALVPFASLFYALLARNLQAGKQAIVNVISTVAYAAAAITLAYQDYGYMALAWANVVNIVVTILVYIPLRPRGIQIFPLFRGWHAPIKFGAGSILGNLTNQLYISIPDLVLGKLNGPHSVGLYSRANGLVNMFQQIIGPTINYNALPYIANKHHANVPLSPLLSQATSCLTGLAWPALVLTAVFAEDVIRVLYGNAWVDAAPLVIILCLGCAGRIGYSLYQPALTAIGKPYLLAVIHGVGIAARIALIFLLGAQDLFRFALAICIADLVTTPLLAVLMSRYLGYTVHQSVTAHIKSMQVTVVCFLMAMLMKFILPASWPDIIRLLLAALGTGIGWVTSIIYFAHPLQAQLPSFSTRILPAKLASRITQTIKPSKTEV